MKAKRVLFVAVTSIVTLPYIFIMLVASAWQIIPGAIACFELAHFRFECWSADYQKGFLTNCPFKRSYKQTFLDAYQGGV